MRLFLLLIALMAISAVVVVGATDPRLHFRQSAAKPTSSAQSMSELAEKIANLANKQNTYYTKIHTDEISRRTTLTFQYKVPMPLVADVNYIEAVKQNFLTSVCRYTSGAAFAEDWVLVIEIYHTNGMPITKPELSKKICASHMAAPNEKLVEQYLSAAVRGLEADGSLATQMEIDVKIRRAVLIVRVTGTETWESDTNRHKATQENLTIAECKHFLISEPLKDGWKIDTLINNLDDSILSSFELSKEVCAPLFAHSNNRE